ncbi:hypothetical protein [Desulfovibrio gilichinskyi]|uniref:tRNA(Ile2) 2-agmatinylcytidine synthetase n=1 Tax=Desulfovibrio gilichinskyi TaxID=1519643 RepID=A0A1X7CUU2_9BACT|nr:hypothetical protein [Desulfovibrio gilichinskyi]SMF03231.1 hypothetical protein SAMN06295933_1273 [Desulfovibrio gilichinskyi]
MRIYLGFDDTDDKDAPIGTGRLVRDFVYGLDSDYQLIGVIRHQLPKLSEIPFTSNNSSACAIIDVNPDMSLEHIQKLAIKHIENYSAPGSDPGLCIARESEVGDEIVEFAKLVTGKQVSQKDAMKAAHSVELFGLGGTNDGIIGATAAIGLTKFGWCGRFIEYGKLRDLSTPLHVQDLNNVGIEVVSTDRDPLVPLPHDLIQNAIWIRPSLWAGKPVLQVTHIDQGIWEPAHGKRKKTHNYKPQPVSPSTTAPYSAG